MLPPVSFTFQQDRLQAAVQERIKVQGRSVRTFAQIVNTALFSVALKAQKYTPKADQAKIDTSLKVTVNFVANKVGKLTPKRKPGTFSYGPGDRVQTVALAKLIVLARADISKQGRATGRSNYNVQTNDRWRLSKDALRGKGTIESIMYGMTAARHSSSALLKAGWKSAMDILRPYIAKNDIGGSRGEPLAYNRGQDRLGTALVAREGWKCTGMIENHVGGGGTALDSRQRAALLEYGSVPLQRAVAEEADAMFKKVEEYMARDAAAFNRK
jgi:hypothetical protein